MNCSTKHRICNAVLFQAGWFACILLPAHTALATTVLILLIHFKMTENYDRELLLVLGVGAIGYTMDSFASLFGLIDFSPEDGSLVYLVCVWLLFASTLNSSLKWISSKSHFAVIAGFIAPLSYYAAQQFGKVKYSEPLSSIVIHALLWGLLMLIVHKLYFDQNSQRINER